MSLLPDGPEDRFEFPRDFELSSTVRKPTRSAGSWLWSLSLHALLFLVLTILFDRAGGGHPGEMGPSQKGTIRRVISAVFLQHQTSSSIATNTVDTRLPEASSADTVASSPWNREIEPVTFRTVEPAPSPEEPPLPEHDSTHPESISRNPEQRNHDEGTRIGPTSPTHPGKVARSSPTSNEGAPSSLNSLDQEEHDPIPTRPANPQPARQTGVHATRSGGARGGPSTQAGGLRGTPGTSFFGVHGHGKRFVYVIDCSASMSERQTFAHARQELLASLELLPATALIQVIYYNDQPHAVAGDRHAALVRNTAAERRRIRQSSLGIVAGGGTMHLPALELALRLEPDAIYWLTDADDPLLTDAEMRQFRRQNSRRIPVHAIEFGSGPALGIDNFLKRVSRESGGLHQYFDLAESAKASTPAP